MENKGPSQDVLEEFDDEDLYESQLMLADERYEIIGDILCQVYQPGKGKWVLSDMLDQVFLHRYLGLPIFLLVVWAMFHFTGEIEQPGTN